MSMWDTMMEYTSEKKAGVPDGEETPAATPVQQETQESDDSLYAAEILFVATNLDSIEADDIRYGHEIMIDVCYRQLDAPYYAYLRHKMTLAKKSHESGSMNTKVYEGLRRKFNTVHEWAIGHIGEDELLKAVRELKPERYVPPSEETYAAYRKTWDEAWEAHRRAKARGEVTGPFYGPIDTRCSGAGAAPRDDSGPGTKAVSFEAKAKVDAIRDKAMSLGWTEEGLYGNSGKFPFPYGDGYGVVRSVGRNCEIGEVTAEAIEIIKTHSLADGTVTHTSLRHYNPLARQPWITIPGQAQAH